MTPILGTMLAIVLTDYCNFLVSLVIVFLGVLCAVFMGFLFSLVFNDDVLDPDNNSQIAARISPRLLDMVAALATGAVGSIALVRNDIAGSLPGVSIAISLVPPLCVAGVCIKLKNWDGMLGAFLLFLTNFSCIVGVGVCVMFGYRVHRMAKRRRMHIARLAASMYQNISIMFVIALLVAVGAMLYYSTRKHQESYEIQACLMQDGLWQYPEPQSAGVDTTWDVTDVNVKVSKSFSFKNITRHAMVTFKGIPPFPAILNLDEVAEECGVDAMELQFIPSYRVEFA